MLTNKRFREIGHALYGDDWQPGLCSDLAVDRRTLSRWSSGAREIPDISGELAALCHEKARVMARLAKLPPPPNLAPEEGRALIEMREARAGELSRLAEELAGA